MQPGADTELFAVLDEMFDEMAAAPEIFHPSAFWEHHNNRNMEQLRRVGFSEFKRTINQNYFAWVPSTPRDPQFRSVLRAWIRHPRGWLLGARLTGAEGVEVGDERSDPFPTSVGRRGHALYLALLWEYARRRDHLGLLDRLDEPGLGEPITIRYRGRRISQDLCNSLLELSSMLEPFPGHKPPDRVLELGSGYGRIAWLFLEAHSSCRYVLCDIPPALGVAQLYLSRLFPDRRIFGFRRFSDYADVAKEFESASIVFLTPNQLELVPPMEADLFVNVSSFHEMRPEQIAHYIQLADRHCEGYAYSKQWLTSVNPYDGVVIHQDDYPIPPHWEPVFSRRHPVQTMFFEDLYKVKPDARSSGSRA